MHHPEGVIFEFLPKGRYVKVSAVDAASGIEASIVGDASAPQERLEALALQKLDWVMGKKK
jgi:hypothetical protein